MTTVLKVNPSNPERKKIRLAAEAIRNGGVVVFPTETVYGIGANALDGRAVSKIFRIKGRPSDNPLIVHVSSIEMAEKIAIIPPKYRDSIKRAWPRPFTIIAAARRVLPRIVTGGLDTVAIRVPSNRIARSLIRESGCPIAAPSANISKKPSSTRAVHALGYFDGKVDVIIDGGKSKFGIESTVIDLDSGQVLRPGAFTLDEVSQFFGIKPKIAKLSRNSAARSPGMKYKHYSPATILLLFKGKVYDLPRITSGISGFAFIGSEASCRAMSESADFTISLGNAKNLKEIASNLFDSLIALDRKHARFAIIQDFPEDGLGIAIMNRIEKASGGKSFNSRRGLDKLLGAI